jgi:hypothetical protein
MRSGGDDERAAEVSSFALTRPDLVEEALKASAAKVRCAPTTALNGSNIIRAQC